MRKYKIGITFNLEAKVTDIWANGANQNVIHLYHLFENWDQKFLAFYPLKFPSVYYIIFNLFLLIFLNITQIIPKLF